MDPTTNGHHPGLELDMPHLTDAGNAKLLVRQFSTRLRHVPGWDRFIVFDRIRWRLDDTGEVDRMAKAVAAGLYDEAILHDHDPKERRAFAEHAIRSESEPRLRAMVKLAKSEPGIPVRPDQLDVNPMFLNLLNGTFDLQQRKLRPHDPADLCTQLAPVAYDPKAECPRFMRFMGRTFAGNKNLIRFMQKAIGYALTGDISELGELEAHPTRRGLGPVGR